MENIKITYKVPHMETIDRTAQIFGLSSYQVRKLARSREGKAFTVRIGNRYLINQTKFATFLNCEGTEPQEVPPAQSVQNGIRPVPVKL